MQRVIQVSHFKKYFKDIKAVDDISFQVEQGELFGFLGVNGAGKSTTINMLCTLLTPTEGSAEVAGFQLGRDNEKIKRHIGVVSQENVLDDLLTVKENLFCRGSLYEKSHKRIQKNMDRVCEIFSLVDIMKRPYGKLSGGQKRRCEIAAALMHTPDILFLDEPTTGLDPATRQSVWETIQCLRREMKMTVFLTTHYMEEAARANHIAIIDHGRLLQFDTPFALKEKFANDRLILTCRTDKETELMRILDARELSYKRKEGRIIVGILDSLSAVPLLEQIQNQVEGFEVIQGTLDDVFLNVCEQKEMQR